MRRSALVVVLAAALAAGCTGDDGEPVETAEIRSGEVVQTVAAPARIEPAARATVSATVGGRVAELRVDDGDRVAAGDTLVRLTSASLDEQVEEAEAAVAASQDAAEAAREAGVDLSPAIGALRSQVDGVFPPLLGALESQVTAAESALEGAVTAIADSAAASDQLQEALLDALAQDDLLEALEGTELLEALAETDALGDLDLDDVDDLDELDLDEIDADALPGGADPAEAIATLEEARRAAADARGQLAATRRAIDDASTQLATAETELQGQAEAAGSAQATVAEAQIEQAERALSAAEAQVEGLVVTAPIAGVVELVRDGGDGASENGQLGDLDALDGLGLGDLDPGSLGGGDSGTEVTGPVIVGREVVAGQPLLRIYDLSSFHADVEVDELDIVEVAAGQPAQLTLDAYPGSELAGTVDHVALSPARGTTGGALYPVTVELTEVPDDVELLPGLTASVEIEVRRIDAELVVPTSALLRRGDGEVVHTVRDGIVHEVDVEVLALGDEDAAIDGPLAAGDEVVTVGVELVEDGDELP